MHEKLPVTNQMQLKAKIVDQMFLPSRICAVAGDGFTQGALVGVNYIYLQGIQRTKTWASASQEVWKENGGVKGLERETETEELGREEVHLLNHGIANCTTSSSLASTLICEMAL